jgi:hypothetical protein
MWNYVQMENGNWYLVDATWDDDDLDTNENGKTIESTYLLIGNQKDMYLNTRILYPNFNCSAYSVSFTYPVLNAADYLASEHQHTWTVRQERKPTCTSSGYCIYQCSVCGVVSGEILDQLYHSYKNKVYVYNQDATCFADGTKKMVCDYGCGEVLMTVTASGTKLTPVIAANASSLKLKVKQSTTDFKVTFATGDSVVSWKSSNKKLVKVTGNADGTCTIKAKAKTGKAKITVTLKSGLSKTITVTVQKTAVKTTKITGVPKTVTLSKGAQTTLTAVVSPFTSKEKLTYTSSNKKVVTVSSGGVVTAKKKGSATITVKSGSKKIKCKIKVK